MAGALGALRSRRGAGRWLLLLVAVICACYDWSGRQTILAQVSRAFDNSAPGPTTSVRHVSAPAPAPAPQAPPTSSDQAASGLAGHVNKLAVLAYIICFQVAKREPPPPKEPYQAGPLEKRRDYSRVLFMSTFLSLLSGIVNAVAIIEMGGTVAHHTGNASHTGRLAGTDGSRFLWLMVAYLAGAGVAGYCRVDGEAVYFGRYSPGMLSSALAVVAGAMIHYVSGNALVALPLLSFSQGIQNAVTRRCSSLPVCTTHMTGYLTDAGIGLGLWAGSGRKEPVPTKTKFFLISIIAFVAGGLVAKLLRDVIGVLAALVPGALMAAVAFGYVPMPRAGPKE